MSERAQAAPQERLLLRVEEMSQALGISRARGYELVSAGQIRSIKIGKSRRVPVDALKEWIADQVEQQSGRVA